MDALPLKRQGWTITAIAAELRQHPAFSKWIANGGPPRNPWGIQRVSSSDCLTPAAAR